MPAWRVLREIVCRISGCKSTEFAQRHGREGIKLIGQKFFDIHESSRFNMSFKCSGEFNIIYIMRTMLLQGPDWNLLAYETHGKVIDARRGLRIHHIGEQDELIDTLGHFRESYHLAPGQCVLIRPDGYVGAFFHGKQSNDIENYLSRFAIGIKDEY